MAPARLLFALLLIGCAHRQAACPPLPASVGKSDKAYAALPSYLEPEQPWPQGPVGRWDDRVPVAGRSRTAARMFGADALDRVRLRLADIDAMAIALRAQPSPPPEAIAGMARLTAELADLVHRRPDLVAEADELSQMVSSLPRAKRLARQRIVDRIEELTDLIRLQIDVG